MKFEVNHISCKNDFDAYLQVVSSFDVINPFYAVFGVTLDEGLFETLQYFMLRNDNDEIIILMPFILRKVPCQIDETTYYDVVSPYGYSGPLYNKSMSRGFLIEFWRQVDAWYKKHDVVSEFIRFSLNHNHQFYNGILIPTLTNVRGKILEPSVQWETFKQKARNNYRKSKEFGLEAKFFTYLEIDDYSIKCFYDIYTSTMNRIGADDSYFYSLNYFKRLLKLSHKNFVLVLICKDDIPISGEIILIAGETLYSYLGGTLNDYFQYRPNDFLKIEVMKWAYNQQYTYYLLGGGRKDGDSLYQYKKSFFDSDPDIIYYTGRKIINSKVYKQLDSLLNIMVTVDSDTPSDLSKEELDYFPAYRRFQLEKK